LVDLGVATIVGHPSKMPTQAIEDYLKVIYKLRQVGKQ